MKFFRLDLLTLLISLFILNSCKNENLVGLVPSSQAINGTIVDTASVYTNTLAEDTISTTGATKIPVGFLNDPIFGTTESDLITDLNLPNNNGTSGNVAYTVPTGTITIDSALLVLKYADGFYGNDSNPDTTNASNLSKYIINVYQLNERLYNQYSYYDNKRWNYNSSVLLGSTKLFQPRPADSLKITTIVHGAKDTLIKVPPQVRIPISPDFIRQNLFTAGSQLTSNLIFQNNVKGFFINVNKSSVSGTGATMMFQSPGDSSLAIYVRTTNGSVVDTGIIYMNITRHATQIVHTYSSQIQSALNLSQNNAAHNTNTPDSLIYLQGNGGLRAKITFPYLQKLFSSIPGGSKGVVINRAELVVTPNTGDIPEFLVPLPKLTLYRYDITDQPFTIEDATSGSNVFFGVPQFGGYYGQVTGNYHFLITSYLQNIINGTTVDYGTYIAPVDTTNTSSVDIAPTIQTSARTVAYGYSKTSPYRIKLNIIYTRTK